MCMTSLEEKFTNEEKETQILLSFCSINNGETDKYINSFTKFFVLQVRSPAFGAAALVTVDQIAAGTAVHAGLQLTLVHVDLAVLPPGQSWS